jgi:hypothetical protein
MLYQRGVMGRSPFEKGETGGFEGDFAAGMVWTYSTNFSDTTLGTRFLGANSGLGLRDPMGEL